MDARRSTSPSIMQVVAQAVEAQLPAVAEAEEALAAVQAVAVLEHRARRFRQFPRHPVPGRPAQPRNLLPAAEVRLPLRRLRALAEEAALVVGVAVAPVVVLRPVAVVVVLRVAAVAVVVLLQFRAWRSSICCWPPVSI